MKMSFSFTQIFIIGAERRKTHGNIITIIYLSEVNRQAKQPTVTEGKKQKTTAKERVI